MTSRERILTTLAHQEPDRVPFDLGGSHVSTIHMTAYQQLCNALNVDATAPFSDIIQQVAKPSEALLTRLDVDTRGLFPLCSHNSGFDDITDKGDHLEHVDEWGFTQRLEKPGGYWWTQTGFPIDGMSVDQQALDNYQWPTAGEPWRIKGLRAEAEAYRADGRFVMCKGLCAGLFEMGQRIRGMENFLCDLLADPVQAGFILDKLVDYKIEFWDMALSQIGDVIDAVVESDDYGTQDSQLISLDTYREMMSPRLRKLMGFIRQKFKEVKPEGEKGYIFFHSCGNVRPMLPDFIEMGVDILNPVHTNAEGMEPVQLKKDFGNDITFWGGGVETQSVLPRGSVDEIREDVKRNLDALMPGGGYVFNTVHNIQAEVPPENIIAMHDALMTFGQYN